MKFSSRLFGTQRIPSIPRNLLILAAVGLFIVASSVEVDLYSYDFSGVSRMLTSFLGISIQTFPFLLTGSLLSAVIGEFVPERTMSRFLGSGGIRSYVSSLAAAFMFPVCDCASVPVAARMCGKGAPVSSAIVFMLASPIVNPVVIASTWAAFSDVRTVLLRILIGIAVSVMIGAAAQRLFRNSGVLSPVTEINHDDGENHECASSCCAHDHDHETVRRESFIARIVNVLSHTGSEFVSVFPFVAFGAMISSAIQAYVPRSAVSGSGESIALQTIVMIAAAFLLSICSTSDAFFARSFLSHVSYGPALGFMTAGPMMDLKNVLMMSRYFRKRFILFIAAAVVIAVFIPCLLVQAFLSGGI
jgi:uncharacterized membrane protein YraQ (UPF0718 family)